MPESVESMIDRGGWMGYAISAMIATSLAAATPAFAESPVFCPLSKFGLASPADLKPKRPSGEECLFRARDRRLYVEITPISPADYEVAAKGGAIIGEPDNAKLIVEEKITVDGREIFLKTFAAPGHLQPRMRIVAVSKFGDLPVKTVGVAQLIKLMSFPQAKLRETVLSTTFRPELTEEDYRAGLPILIDDFAGFKVLSATNDSIRLGAGANETAGTDDAATVFIRLLNARPPADPQTGDPALKQELEAGLRLGADKVVETDAVIERDGLKWYEFRATGSSPTHAEPVLATSVMRMEAGKRMIAILGIVLLKDRVRFEERLRTLLDNISLR
jgi:hypothetical protein